MTKEENELWQKIDAFTLDEQGAGFRFSARLARENGWSIAYTHRVIAEYKRFIFMCCVTDSGVTPSDPVDQAWHLHLTFTRSYWTDLCKNTVGREIHHNPTKGGEQEAKKFDSLYTSTHQLYVSKFGTIPPADIWQTNQERFSDINFQRVNIGQYWLVKKPRFTVHKLVTLSLLVSVAVLMQASDSTFAILVMLGVITVVTVGVYRMESNNWETPGGKKRNDNGSGCSMAGCGGDASSHHGGSHGHGDGHGGDSGCSSGCSGCSSSGCSGCGGGGD